MAKYKYDPFLRTQVNVIALLIAFSVFLLILVGILFDFLYRDVSLAIITGVRDTILAQQSTADSSLQSLDTIRSENLSAMAFLMALATVIFGYLLTRVALSPTRNALSAQKRFIGNIAHELRTPLSNIKTNAEVALMAPDLNPEMRDIFESTVEDLDRLSNIINNLLSLSVSVRPERIEFEKVNISKVIDNVVVKVTNLADKRHLMISVNKSGSVWVQGNDAALEQVLTNIVKNAIAYTPHGGQVRISARHIGPANVEIIVQDSGEGIAQQDLLHIFEPFYRADTSRSRARGGSGLGLTIVSELVKLHRGKVTVRSTLGRGTTVLVILPSASPTSDAPRVEHILDEVGVDYSREHA